MATELLLKQRPLTRVRDCPVAIARRVAEQNSHPTNLAGLMHRCLRRSGARLLAIATKGLDLAAKLLRTLHIAPCQGDSQGEFKLFKLMFAFSGPMGGGAWH